MSDFQRQYPSGKPLQPGERMGTADDLRAAKAGQAGQKGMDDEFETVDDNYQSIASSDASKISRAETKVGEGDEDLEDLGEDLGEDVGEDVAEDSTLEEVGAGLDATGILAPLGVLFNVAGLGLAAYQAGKGISEIITG